MREEGLKELGENLCNNLIISVAKSYGSIIRNLSRASDIWDQTYMGLVVASMELI